MIYIKYIKENYFAIWHDSDYVKHNTFSVVSFQTLEFLQNLFVNGLKHLTKPQS